MTKCEPSRSLKMVKVLLAGLLAAEGAEAAQFFPPAGFRVPFLRSDNSGCCTKITISGAKNEGANGVYNAVMENATTGKLANGFMYYMREDNKAVCHHADKAWICASIDDCAVPGTDCANPMHGYSAIATNQGCIINQMTSNMAWQSAYDWLNRGTETFRIDEGFKMTCQGDVDECANDAYNSCPTNSDCSNTVGGYDCTCQPGKTCEDFDQCGPNGGGVCPEGSSCLEGSEMNDDSNGYSCSCDAGYTHNDATKKCEDDDECIEKDFNGCDFRPNSVCKNTAGSFECECPNTTDNKFSTDADGNCVDFDECVEGGHNCADFAHTACRNTVGSWECDCPVGFTGNKTIGCSNIDECKNDPSPCGEHQDCTDNTPVSGSAGYDCKCQSGFNTNTDGSCSDINECAAIVDPCKDKTGTVCSNNDGGFTCECTTGYKYDETDKMCKNIDDCADEFKVNGTSIYCSENSHCKDTEGSYVCLCNSGFSENDAGDCIDEDECSDKNADDVCGRQNSTCTNTEGGHECGCVEGMALNGQTPEACVAIDYCNPTNVTLKPDCAWTGAWGGCVNNYKTFKGECKCNDGYQSGVDDKGRPTCVDVDECKAGTGKCEKENTECVNINGGFECNCKNGWEMDTTTKECKDVDECQVAVDAGTTYCSTANTECINMAGRAGCACKPGYGIKIGTAGCVNKNECEMKTDDCVAKDPYSECKDEEGSFSCPCISGYKEEKGNCTNIDDCGGNNCPGDAECVDGVNAYSCACKAGYAKNETASTPADDKDTIDTADDTLEIVVCYDVDECATGAKTCTDKPNEVCKNTVGLATCVCADGWTVDTDIPKVNQTCTVDVNECGETADDGKDVANNQGPCMDNAKCSNTAGSYTCACSKGWKLSDDKTACNNVNECDNGFVCSKPNSQCVDNDGSAGCACIDGYHEVNQTCVDYDECKEVEPCNFKNARCENTDASFLCHCDFGYAQNVSALSDDSNDDLCVNINECGDLNGTVWLIPETHNCGEHQFCTDSVGSFDCACNIGFVDVNAGNDTLPMKCEDVDECDESTSKQHTCDDALFQACNNLPGSFECGCMTGYEKNVTNTTSGEFDCIDTNECNGAHTCTALEDCADAEGTYTCTCKKGYTKKVTNTTSGEYICDDVDECADGSQECHSLASCSNTVGSYTCKCPGEYQGDGKQCLMCPSTECWDYDPAQKRCTPKDACSKLACDGDGFGISFSPFLFGLKKDEPANWGSKVQPTFDDATGEYSVKTGFGADYGMSYKMEGQSITFSLMISMSGNERVSHMRSDYKIDAADTLELGNRQIVVNPFGVGMVFQCTYPTLVKLSSVGYTVEDVSISSSLKGQGQWTDAFAMSLNNGNDAEFILGQVLPVSVSWKVTTMQSDLTFFYVGCTVTHGATDIAVIKDGCYAGATGSQPLPSTPTEQNMSFKIFKGVNEAATEQTIECSVLICEPAKCSKPKSNADCPTGEHDAFYEYTFNGGV
jgi:hypothetical protein